MSSNATISSVGRLYLRLQLCTDVGPIRLRRLLDRFGTVDAILGASRERLEGVEGVGPATARSILTASSDDTIEREAERAAACGAQIRCWEDADYPEPLRHIPDPPVCLFMRGTWTPQDTVAVAIVGSRRCSRYGREQAMRFGSLLGGAGFTVISGLARGVDGDAHRGALQARGRTIAVLGNGLSTVYPPEHAELAEAIVAGGVVMAEVPMDTPPEAQNFPSRNRIIVGLTLGVIIVEAGRRSGALISARLASEYNREVFAIPGRIDQPETSAGTNRLIQSGGAKLVTCLEDVLDELGEVGAIMAPPVAAAATKGENEGKPASASRVQLTENERAVAEAIGADGAGPDQICTRSQLEFANVAAALTTLQLKGVIEQLPGPRYCLRKPGG